MVNKTMNLTGSSKLRNLSYSSLVASILFFLVSLVYPTLLPSSTHAEVGIDPVTTLSISPSSTLSLIAEPGSFVSGTETINVSTNNYTGYTLTMTTNGNSTDLLSSSTDVTIPTITLPEGVDSITSTDFTTAGYGYSLNSTDFMPVPSTDSEGVVIATTTPEDPRTNDHTLTFGAKTDITTPAGTYEKTFTISAIANAVGYTITYDANVDASELENITNMPSPNPKQGTISGVDIYLDTAIPQREGYAFLGWAIANDATTPNYEAGDSFALDPETNNEMTLYAVWAEAVTFVFDGNGYFFDEAGAQSTNTVKYINTCKELGWVSSTSTISKTSNIDAEGNMVSYNTSNSSYEDTVTISGARALKVELTFGYDQNGGMEVYYDGNSYGGAYYDYFWSEDWENNRTTTSVEFIIASDTVSFLTYHYDSPTVDYYGYFAKVYPIYDQEQNDTAYEDLGEFCGWEAVEGAYMNPIMPQYYSISYWYWSQNYWSFRNEQEIRQGLNDWIGADYPGETINVVANIQGPVTINFQVDGLFFDEAKTQSTNTVVYGHVCNEVACSWQAISGEYKLPILDESRGQVFDQWYDYSSGGEFLVGFIDEADIIEMLQWRVINDPLTLEGHYYETATVNFHGNGGTATHCINYDSNTDTCLESESFTVQTQTLNAGRSYPFDMPYEFTRDGYILAGWATDPNATDIEYGTDNYLDVPNDGGGQVIDLYAIWANYILRYDANGGYDAPKLQFAIDSSSSHTFTISDTTPAKYTDYPYIFIGWSTVQDATMANYQPASSITVSESITTLYAVWASYSIVFDGNGSDAGNMTDLVIEKIVQDEEITLFPSNFSKNNYSFVGWSTNSSATPYDGISRIYGPSETITATEDLMATHDSNYKIKLYAIWVQADTTHTMQTFDHASFEAENPDKTIIALKDERDNEVYTVAKLADGRWWMVENLRLDIKTANITTSNTHNPSQTFLDSITTSSGSSSPTSSELTSGAETILYNAQAAINRAISPQKVTDDLYGYGGYYNWYTATAGRGTRDVSHNGREANGDICPLSWKLPSFGNDSDFTRLSLALGGLATDMDLGTNPTGRYISNIYRSYPNNFVLGGLYGDTGFAKRGGGRITNAIDTRYYSRNGRGDMSYQDYGVYSFQLTKDSVQLTNSYGSYAKFMLNVRCVAESR